MKNLYSVLLLICIQFNTAFAVNNAPIDYLGIEQGLSNNAVTCIYQDKYGFMWFGTYEGLNRYDGYSFKVFKNRLNDANSLIHNWVVSISQDQEENIWVGTKQGPSVYRPATGKFSPVYFRIKGSSAFNKLVSAVNDIEVGLDGTVYLGTGNRGLLVKEKGSETVDLIPLTFRNSDVDYHVQGIEIDKKGQIWLFIQGSGIARYDQRSRTIELVAGKVFEGNCIRQDLQGNIWIGTETGLHKYNIATRSYQHFYEKDRTINNNYIHGLDRDKDGQIWVSTDGGGVNIIDPKTNKVRYLLPGKEKGSLTSGAVNAVFEDKDRRMWIGTLRGGINILDSRKARFETIAHNPFNKNSLLSNFILSFCEDEKGNLWIGTDGAGISYWNRAGNSFTHYVHQLNNSRSLSNNNVASIIRDYKNDVWVATYGGAINKFDKATGSFVSYPCFNPRSKNFDRNAWRLYEDKNKTLWAGMCSWAGTYFLNRSTDKFELFDPGLKDVIAIAEDRQSQLWMGTFTDLVKVDRKNKKHERYTFGYSVRAIFEDSHGNFWVGTEGGGLLLFDRKTGDYKTFTEDEGLPNNSILNILEDESGELWISTYNGLSRFNLKTRKFKNFYERDGLQSNQFNFNAALKLTTGEFLFGGIKGFNIFRPEEIRNYNFKQNLLITGLRINNIAYEADSSIENKQSLFNLKELTLPYDKAVISVDFASLDYSGANKISYKYILEGWDNTWNYAGNARIANYSRLREGKYLLRIRSTNAEGAWMPEERTLQLTILPPWWRSWWAYAVYALMAAAVLYAYNYYQRRQARLQYQVQLANLRVEQEKELNEKKLSFFTHISHEFRTPLTLIINPIKEFLNSRDSYVDSKELTVVYRNARRLLSLVDQLLLFRKSDADALKVTSFNLVTFCKEVYLCFTQQAKSKNITFEFQCSSSEIQIYGDKEKIEIALFNLISNAFKFTPDGGRIQFCLQETERSVSLSVADSGPGISGEDAHKLFDRFYQVPKKENAKAGFGIGLYLVKKFIDAHQGKVTFESSPGAGTSFCIELLKGKDQFDSQLIYESLGENPTFLEELVAETALPEPLPLLEKIESPDTEIVSERSSMLIVDDNDEIRSYIKRIFEGSYTLYEARSGEEGLTLIGRYAPDIVITDVVMGEMSGVDLCLKVKEDPALSHTPVILLTSSSSPEIKLKGIEGGADDYITKPFDKDILIARVSNLLKSKNNLQRYFYNQITFKSDDLKVSADYKDFLDRCIEIVEKNIDDSNFNIKVLAEEIGMSHSALYKKVKSISGKTVNEFIRFIRLRKAAQLFINTDCNVNEAAFQAGFSDIKYFREQFSKLFGLRPSEYIKTYRRPFNKTYKLNNKMRE